MCQQHSSLKPVVHIFLDQQSLAINNNNAVHNGLLIRSASTDPSSTSSPSPTSAPETLEGEEDAEPKLQSPYHFSLSSNVEGVEGDVHHYHPEPYPEGITDEKVRTAIYLYSIIYL